MRLLCQILLPDQCVGHPCSSSLCWIVWPCSKMSSSACFSQSSKTTGRRRLSFGQTLKKGAKRAYVMCWGECSHNPDAHDQSDRAHKALSSPTLCKAFPPGRGSPLQVRAQSTLAKLTALQLCKTHAHAWRRQLLRLLVLVVNECHCRSMCACWSTEQHFPACPPQHIARRALPAFRSTNQCPPAAPAAAAAAAGPR